MTREAHSDVARTTAATALAGISVAASPWILNYPDDDLTVLCATLGAAIVIVAAVRGLGAQRAAWLSWVNVVLGIILLAGGALFADSRRGLWATVVLSLLVISLATWSAGTAAQSTGDDDRAGV